MTRGQRFLTIGERLREAVYLLLLFLGGYFSLSLLCYAQGPLWLLPQMKAYKAVINQLGLGDTAVAQQIFAWFGVFAYITPVLGFLLYQTVKKLQASETRPGFVLVFFATQLTGLSLLILSACIAISGSQIRYQSVLAGRLGTMLRVQLSELFSPAGLLILLMATFLMGFTLCTGYSCFRLFNQCIEAIYGIFCLLKYALLSGLHLVHRGIGYIVSAILTLLKAFFWIKKFLVRDRARTRGAEREAEARAVEGGGGPAPNNLPPQPRAGEGPTGRSLYTPPGGEGGKRGQAQAIHRDRTVSALESAATPLRPGVPEGMGLMALESTVPSHIGTMRPGQSPQHRVYIPPSVELLDLPAWQAGLETQESLEAAANLIESTLEDYKLPAQVVSIQPGPVVTRYELSLAPGVKAIRLSNLARDLARSLSVEAVRVVEVIPGKPYVGIELPNSHRKLVGLRELFQDDAFKNAVSPLSIPMGQTISGDTLLVDLSTMPHLLIAGTTGSGKSVGIHSIIISLLYKASPEEVRFILIDPKMLELSVYSGIPHLLSDVVTDMNQVTGVLEWCVEEMEQRYQVMSAVGVRNIVSFNEKVEQSEASGAPVAGSRSSMEQAASPVTHMPYIVVIIDEFADLMSSVGKRVEGLITRLAQKARAAGIHLLLATQRPSVDVITGVIKANIPSRIAFTVSSKIDSRTILDQSGAESLLGAGDMLYLPANSTLPVRVQGAFVHDLEVQRVVAHLKRQAPPQYIALLAPALVTGENLNGLQNEGQEEADPLFEEVVEFVQHTRKGSISAVQRRFKVGYNRAARLVDSLESSGVLRSTAQGGQREVLFPPIAGRS